MGAEKETRQRAFLAVAGAAGLLLSVAVILHASNPHPDALLQTKDGFERRLQALKELKAQSVAQSVLFGAEKQAYMNGYMAGEQQAESDVAADDALSLSGKQELSGNQLIALMSGGNGQSEEDQMANAIAMRVSRMDKIAGLNQEVSSAHKKQSALDRLSRKAGQSGPQQALAKPGSQEALKLMDFCARSFKGDEMLQRFCYDRLISEPTSRPATLKQEVPTMPEFAIVQPPGDPRPELFRVVPVPANDIPGMTEDMKEMPEDTESVEYSAPSALMEAAARVHKAKKAQNENPTVEVKASSLQQSIENAHKMGLEGSPKAIEYHEGGKDALYVLDKSAQTENLAQVQEQMRGAPTQMMAQMGSPKVEVDAHSLQSSIERAHKLGMSGVPEDIVYHPAHGSPEIYKLASEKSFPSPDSPIRPRRYSRHYF